MRAKLIDIQHPKHAETMAEIMLQGGIVGALWGHHLYFLCCNGFNSQAVRKMNLVKGRPETQVFASPGAVEEAEEFADLKKSRALVWAAKKMKMTPRDYIEFLYHKFPLAIELFAKAQLPAAVTFTTPAGKTIWIAGHMADRVYSKLLEAVRSLRRQGQKILFAGTSLNLKGDNTLTIRDFDKVLSDFARHLDAIAVHPKVNTLKKLRYSTSSSVISFIGQRPTLKRLGCSRIATLKKYIPGLQIEEDLTFARRS